MNHHRIRTWMLAWALCLVTALPGLAAASDQPVNLNTATVTELMTVKGIGETTAKAIVSHREQNGPFKSVDDLVSVKGIGDKRLASMRDRLTADQPSIEAAAKPAK